MKYKVYVNCIIGHEFEVEASSCEEAEQAGHDYLRNLPYLETENHDVNVSSVS